MKAMIYKNYGSPDVLQLQELEKPSPKDDEVLIKVHAASINAADFYMLKGEPFFLRFDTGLQKPKRQTLGFDLAGQVEAVGKDVKQFQVGDAVFGDVSGFGGRAFAEYTAVSEKALVLKPARLSFEEAASLPMASVTALQGLRDKGQIQAGQKVLVYGASGGVGTYAVQIAKAFGAEVTAVCSTRKMEMLRSIGVDYLIDYNKEDFTKNGQRYDLIIAVNGYRSIFDYQRALTPNGICVTAGGKMSQIFQSLILGPFFSRGTQKMHNVMGHSNQEDLAYVTSLVEAGKVTPFVDRCYPLAELAEAFRYFETGNAKGKIVINMQNN